MHVQSCCFAYITYCFFYVLVAVRVVRSNEVPIATRNVLVTVCQSSLCRTSRQNKERQEKMKTRIHRNSRGISGTGKIIMILELSLQISEVSHHRVSVVFALDDKTSSTVRYLMIRFSSVFSVYIAIQSHLPYTPYCCSP